MPKIQELNSEFRFLADRLNPLFNEFFPAEYREQTVMLDWLPAIDIYENDNSIIINAELPGMDKKDVDINVTDNMLTIKGEKKFDKQIKKDNYHKCERCYGTFSRTFTLPDSVNPDDVKAQFKNGILEVSIPKKERSKPKEITIE